MIQLFAQAVNVVQDVQVAKAALHVTVVQFVQTAQDVQVAQAVTVVNLALDVTMGAIHIINNSKIYSKIKNHLQKYFLQKLL